MAQAGDGESDVLRAGPAWPRRSPCESVLPVRLSWAGSGPGRPWSQVWFPTCEAAALLSHHPLRDLENAFHHECLQTWQLRQSLMWLVMALPSYSWIGLFLQR